MKGSDRRWLWLPLVLGVIAFKNVVLVPRLDWGVSQWAVLEILLTVALVVAGVEFLRWAFQRR